ncbi:MAG: A/G-specific adenine glycosylase, partial [Kordiimonas sp.]
MSSFADNLLNWYDSHRRVLPWRALPNCTSNPYHVWLSEIMLQQTTVATVKSYFEKFLKLWPTIDELAAASQEVVLKEWAGLGYYARARNLHKCAQVIVSEHGSKFPEKEDDLRALPGIGDYTAAAIAAIAFGEKTAVVDGNIERIISRTFRIKTALPAAKKEIKTEVSQLTPTDRPGDFAQAMMDLGASLCSPKKPSCLLCPVSGFCAAQTKGDMEHYPVKAPKKIKPVRRAISFWLEHDGHVLLERRPQKGL